MPLSGRRASVVMPLQQRHAEGEGLAHAGAGLADQIVTCQGERERQLLDGEGVLDAVLGECADDLGAYAELGEGRGRGNGLGSFRWFDGFSGFGCRINRRHAWVGPFGVFCVFVRSKPLRVARTRSTKKHRGPGLTGV